MNPDDQLDLILGQFLMNKHEKNFESELEKPNYLQYRPTCSFSLEEYQTFKAYEQKCRDAGEAVHPEIKQAIFCFEQYQRDLKTYEVKLRLQHKPVSNDQILGRQITQQLGTTGCRKVTTPGAKKVVKVEQVQQEKKTEAEVRTEQEEFGELLDMLKESQVDRQNEVQNKLEQMGRLFGEVESVNVQKVDQEKSSMKLNKIQSNEVKVNQQFEYQNKFITNKQGPQISAIVTEATYLNTPSPGNVVIPSQKQIEELDISDLMGQPLQTMGSVRLDRTPSPALVSSKRIMTQLKEQRSASTSIMSTASSKYGSMTSRAQMKVLGRVASTSPSLVANKAAKPLDYLQKTPPSLAANFDYRSSLEGLRRLSRPSIMQKQLQDAVNPVNDQIPVQNQPPRQRRNLFAPQLSEPQKIQLRATPNEAPDVDLGHAVSEDNVSTAQIPVPQSCFSRRLSKSSRQNSFVSNSSVDNISQQFQALDDIISPDIDTPAVKRSSSNINRNRKSDPNPFIAAGKGVVNEQNYVEELQVDYNLRQNYEYQRAQEDLKEDADVLQPPQSKQLGQSRRRGLSTK